MCLHGWKLDRRLRKICHRVLYVDEAPELTAKEVVHVTAAEIVHGLLPNRRRPLERILTDVDDRWHVRFHLLSRPTIGLLVEPVLEIIDSHGTELRATEVEEFMPHRWPFAFEQVRLVEAIEMVLVGPVAELHPFKKLVGNIGVASGGRQGWQPIESGEDAVLDRARLHMSRPAD